MPQRGTGQYQGQRNRVNTTGNTAHPHRHKLDPPILSQPSDMGQGQRWFKHLLCFLQIHPQSTHMGPSVQSHHLPPKIAMLPLCRSLQS